MNKFSDEYLAELAAMPENERGDLSIVEKRALTRYFSRLKRENTIRPDLVPAGTGVGIDIVTPEPAAPAAGENESEYSKTVKAMDWMTDWPANLIVPYTPASKWADQAQALREFPGRIARLANGLRRRNAVRLRHSIMTAKIKSFSPAGSYRAEAALDADGTCSVYAVYTGEPK
jgi:hypothetical protein